MLKSAKTGKRRSGQSQLISYLSGKKLTRTNAIKAKCYDCDGMGETGECDIDTCALYHFTPFKSKSLVKRKNGVSSAKESILISA